MRDIGGGGGGRGGVRGGRPLPDQGPRGGGVGGQLTERVRQAAEEVQTFAAQRALELALEANGLTSSPAMRGFQDELERAALGARGLGNPITEGPASRILTAPRRMAPNLPEAGAPSPARPLPTAPRGAPPPMQTLPNAPTGGPSAIERVGRPRRVP